YEQRLAQRLEDAEASLRPRSGLSRTPVQGGLEGMALDQPTFRPENTPDEVQGALGIGSGERPIEELPMFARQADEATAQTAQAADVAPVQPETAQPSAEHAGGLIPQRSVLTSDVVDTD